MLQGTVTGSGMDSSGFRILSGENATPQRLVDLCLPPSWVSLSQPEFKEWSTPTTSPHLLLMAPRQPVSYAHAGKILTLDPGGFVWVASAGELRLRPCGSKGTELLAWHFTAAALPPPMRELLPPGEVEPAFGPATLTTPMQTIVLALRSCPVAPTLRALWSTGKLIELLTLILPAPAANEGTEPPHAAHALHPAVRLALDFMAARLAEPIGLPEMAAAAHTSPSHLSRLFTAELGHGPTRHLRRLRLERAAALLAAGHANVTEAALAAGYASLGQFSRTFAEHHGRPPSAFLPRRSA